jgi:hypothetical protein
MAATTELLCQWCARPARWVWYPRPPWPAVACDACYRCFHPHPMPIVSSVTSNQGRVV